MSAVIDQPRSKRWIAAMAQARERMASAVRYG
jgi:hypothetical protein